MRRPKYIYLSGPMTGMPKLNFPLFHKVTKQLRKAGYKVINPAELDGNSAGKLTWEDCLRRDLAVLVNKCYAIATLPGYKKSRGAMLEIYVAKQLDMAVKPYEYFLEKGA